LAANKFRYASLAAGFVLFVAPFALFTRLVYAAVGNTADPTLHSVCFRMPLDWLIGGRFTALWGSVAAMFAAAVVVSSYFARALFCGWLCPVGAISEALSRWGPLKRFRLRIRDSQVTSTMRWGFMAGFVMISISIGCRMAPGFFGSICCRFCSSSLLQNCSSAVLGDASALAYWHSGSILTAGGWLLVWGLLLAGGRGWLATRFDKALCKECPDCQVTCPMGAVRPDRAVQTELCINCYECTHACISGAHRCSAPNLR
jgi:polyferredoxin